MMIRSTHPKRSRAPGQVARALLAAALAATALAAGAQKAQAPPTVRDGTVPQARWGDMKGKPFARVPGTSVTTLLPVVDYPNPTRPTNPDWEGKEEEMYGGKKYVRKADELPPVFLDNPGIATNALTTDFIGIGQTALRPPDCSMAVGRDHIVQTVNDRFRISDKAGITIFEADIPDWLSDPNGFYFDPKVIYDPWRSNFCMLWHRWDDANQQSQLVLIGSDDSNPVGTWYVHRFDSDITISGKRTKPDYFDLGYCSKAIVISGNMFNWDGTGFSTGAIAMFNPAEIYTSGGAGWLIYVGFNNANGTEAATIRPAHMLRSFGSGWDQILVNSAGGGGNFLSVWKLTDPLNTDGNLAFNRTTITVNAYTLPPNANQPGSGSTLDTIDCRLMPVYVDDAAPGQTTSSTLYTGLSDASADGTRAEARLFVVDPIAGTKALDTSFTDGTNDYWFPTPSAEYGHNCTWVFARAGTVFGEARFVTWDPAGGLGTSVVLKAGEGLYTLSRWGDYFGGEPDWGDYYLNGLSSGRQKMWFYAEYAETGNVWGTWVGCTRPIGVAAGSMSVSPAADQSLFWYRGAASGPDVDYTVTNSGDVSFLYRVRSLASWLAASPSQDEVGTTPNTGHCFIGPDASGLNLNFGVYSDTFQFENAYTGSLLNRTIEGRVGELLKPATMTVELGKLNSGDVTGFAASGDGIVVRVCKFVVPNANAYPVTVRLDATLSGSGATTVSDVVFTVRSRVTVGGAFIQTLELFNWQTNGYDAQSVTNAVNTTFANRSLNPNGDLTRFVNQTTRQMRARVKIKPNGVVASASWCGEFDYGVFDTRP
ncbi:MAG: hypothetical protein JST30_08090 [Armatimonadetes bacterium]|nr:hypothetical protein [Armatimonadota bacterium]